MQFTNTEIILIGALFLVLVAAGFFIDRLTKALVEQGKTMADLLPPWVVDFIDFGGDRALDTLEPIVRDTPNTVDDQLLALMERKFDELVASLRGTVVTPDEVQRIAAETLANALKDTRA
jgi:hypothetical protein